METFGCWTGLLDYLESNATVYYQAPLDTTPTLVWVTKRFKNRKLRLLPLVRDPHPFTVDPGHLDRFRYRP